ncbi:MAG: hypothetical protein AAFV49_24045, partial [Pseudomonadota bacterium]
SAESLGVTLGVSNFSRTSSGTIEYVSACDSAARQPSRTSRVDRRSITARVDPAALASRFAADIAARAPFRHLTTEEAPDLDAAHAIQIETARALAEDRGPLGGRKIAWNTAPQMEQFGMPEPGAARVFASQILGTGARLAAADYATFAMEPEIAAVLKAPLAPVEGGHDPA